MDLFCGQNIVFYRVFREAPFHRKNSAFGDPALFGRAPPLFTVIPFQQKLTPETLPPLVLVAGWVAGWLGGWLGGWVAGWPGWLVAGWLAGAWWPGWLDGWAGW